MRMAKIPIKASVLLSAIALVQPASWYVALAAQGTDGSADPVVCLARSGDDGRALSIIVPAAAEKAMSDKGFVREPCSQNFGSVTAREGYRDAVCHMAATYREDQIAVFERRYGERPGVLCGMAEVAVSEWPLRD